MDRPIVSRGEWYAQERGRVAHHLVVDGGSYTYAECGFRGPVLRPATPEDRRCKRCEERSRG